MKIKRVPEKINKFTYEEDYFPEKRGIPSHRKGDVYWQADKDWVAYKHYEVQVFSDLGFIDATSDAIKKKDKDKFLDYYYATLIILQLWDSFEEEELKKIVNRSKSKKLCLTEELIKLANIKGFQVNWKVDLNKVNELELPQMFNWNGE